MAKKRVPASPDTHLKTAATTTTHSFSSVAAPVSSLSAAPGPSAHLTLEAIRADLGDCQRCGLCQHRQHLVFGEGNPRAELLFVSEAPSVDEDASGRPLAGPAGQLLSKMIEAMGVTPRDVYLTTVVKCRPPEGRHTEGRQTEAPEAEKCLPFLKAQIQAVRPKVIVTLGEPAARYLLQTQESLASLRGKIATFEGLKVIPTFHPEHLLRTPAAKKESWEDLKIALRELNWKPKTPARS